MYILNKQGEVETASDIETWAHWMRKNREFRQIDAHAYELPGVGLIVVSTVFTGLSMTPFGPPQVFETASFVERATCDGSFARQSTLAQDRASTMQGAIENHLRHLHRYGHAPCPN